MSYFALEISLLLKCMRRFCHINEAVKAPSPIKQDYLLVSVVIFVKNVLKASMRRGGGKVQKKPVSVFINYQMINYLICPDICMHNSADSHLSGFQHH